MSTTNIRIKKNQSIDIKIISELLKLMKPRVMSLVIFTCAVGLLISPVTIPLKEAMLGILFVAMGAGAAGTLNMWYEADLDKLMSRTCLRPIPRGKINRNQALVFGILLSITSVTTNSLSLEPLILFLIIFIWTPSHFWALSLYKANDYKKAKIPMLPITDGIENTKKNILVYSLLMLPIIISPYIVGFAGLTYLVPALALTLYYNYICLSLYKFKKDKFDIRIARQVFSYSILYLFLLFVLFLLDKII